MPNRIIKESICTSDNVDQLTPFQETMFIRLIVNCDDYGRMDARPKILAAKLFPLKDIRTSQIEDALRALTSAELVILYSIDGKPFLQMKTWERHQTVRAKKSRYPGPDNENAVCESNCMQMHADDSKCSRNPIQSNTESESNPNPNARSACADFAVFWSAYPRKEAKQAAKKAWDKLRPDEALLSEMLRALEKQRASPQWTKDGGQFIPQGATWLNGRRWEDEPVKGPSAGKIVTAQQYQQREYSEAELEAVSGDLLNEARAARGGAIDG